MNKRKIAKKIIRFKYDNAIFYKFDKFLKISRIKIINMELLKNINGGDLYKIIYKHGFNFWNPLTLIVVISLLLIGACNGIKEVLEGLRSDEYTSEIKIKRSK